MSHEEEMMIEHGSYANEFAAAYDLSQIENPADDRGKVRDLVKAGRFVVVEHFERFCRITDASLGDGVAYVSDHATREEAEGETAKWDPEGACLVVEGPVTEEPAAETPHVSSSDEILF